MIMGLLDEAVTAGARQSRACEVLGLDCRTVQRWTSQQVGEDHRAGPKLKPANALSSAERRRVLEVANKPEHSHLSPKQLVPILADKQVYIASESTFYRILRAEGQLHHRESSRAPQSRHRPKELRATGPNQVWSWDITYLRSPIRGAFYMLYMVMDVWSRKIVGSAVHAEESSALASELIETCCFKEGISPDQLVIHSDNGSPMKGATLLSTLQGLGVVASFSRPSVSNDNPYSEALFRTAKYRPEFPRGCFACLEAANDWVARFVDWYNTRHLHSAIRFVTPDDRHNGRELAILRARRKLYSSAKARKPERWAGKVRNWNPVAEVSLNPDNQPRRNVA
jgi:transposase InsO family protein